MWSRQRIVEDLADLHVRAGDSVLVHASMRAIGTVDGGAETVLDGLLEAVGPDGTVAAAAFNSANRAESEGEFSPGARVDQVGIVAAKLACRPGAVSSVHPTHAFAAVGRNAGFITSQAPFHYPLGSGSPLARLHQLGGRILLIGVDHTVNAAYFLAENWADAPYSRRTATVRTEDGRVTCMDGEPGCSAGFAKAEPVLRQARILRSGYVGNAPSQSMMIQHVVSMAVAMLRGNPESLLCDDGSCPLCAPARTFTRHQDPASLAG